MDTLSKMIIQTICYFDVFDMPLTVFEIKRHLVNYSGEKLTKDVDLSLFGVVTALEDEKLKQFIEQKNGFYFLKHRETIIGKRKQRARISIRKFKIAAKMAHILKELPFIRMVAVTGTMAMRNARKESDIDYFLIIKKGRIFFGRTLVTLAAQIAGIRRYANLITDRVCLNYFAAEDGLEVQRKDLFGSNEYSFILPLLGFNAYRIFQKTNSWIQIYKPNYYADTIPNEILMDIEGKPSGIKRILEAIFEFLGAQYVEKLLESWQISRIKNNPNTFIKGNYVEANSKRLVFIPKPQGPKVYQLFKERLAEVNEKIFALDCQLVDMKQ